MALGQYRLIRHNFQQPQPHPSVPLLHSCFGPLTGTGIIVEANAFAKDLQKFDYIKTKPNNSDKKYVMMFCTDHTDYICFFAFAKTSAQNGTAAHIE